MKTPAQITILTLSVVLAFAFGMAVEGSKPVDNAPGYLFVEGQKIPVYQGSEVEVFIEGKDDLTAKGTGKGADLSTTIDSFADKFHTEAPAINLDGTSSLGGSAAYTAKGLAAKGHMVIIFAGVLCVIGGVVCAVKWDRKMGTWIAIAGGILIVVGVAFERYPALAIILPVVGIGVVVYFWWRARQGSRKQLTLDTIIKGVNQSPPEASSVVKTNIGTADNNAYEKDVVKTEIRARKRALAIT